MTRRNGLNLLIVLGVGTVVSLIYGFGLFDTWQEKIFDRLFTTSPAPQNIVIVAIDNESIHAVGNWPWRRSVFAQTLTHLQQARTIGIDVAFTERSSYGVQDDSALRRAMEEKGNVVLPVQFDDRGEKVVLPSDALGTPEVGFANVLLDADGIVRQLQAERSPYTALSVRLAGGSAYPSLFRISYLGPAKTIPTIPFIDVYDGSVPEDVFKDKTVLIGVTANDLHDIVGTPFGVMAGVEVHANAVATLQSGVFLTPVSKVIAVLLIFLVVILVFAAVRFVHRFSLLVGVFIAIFVAGIGACVGLFMMHMLLPILYLVFADLLCAGILIAFEYFTESRDRRFIQKTFAYYLMPEIIDDLMKDPSKLRLGGEKRRVSILFSDIRGFTSISEKLSAEELTVLMNEYLTAMTDSIMEDRGLVDKYIGDAIMAFWGAPVANPNLEKDACKAALEMSQKLVACNTVWGSRGIPPIRIGIGINTGDVVVGNMGSQKRFNYTIMGDEVNFGSRLESITKVYGVECLISESTARAVEHDPHYTLRELDLVMVKGKKEPKRIFELVTRTVTDTLRQQFEYFREGRTLYVDGKFKEACLFFEKSLALGEDGPSNTFMERCQLLEKDPPAEWEGVYEFTTK